MRGNLKHKGIIFETLLIIYANEQYYFKHQNIASTNLFHFTLNIFTNTITPTGDKKNNVFFFKEITIKQQSLAVS